MVSGRGEVTDPSVDHLGCGVEGKDWEHLLQVKLKTYSFTVCVVALNLCFKDKCVYSYFQDIVIQHVVHIVGGYSVVRILEFGVLDMGKFCLEHVGHVG